MVDNMELESIDSLLNEIDALKEELKYCNESDRDLINADIKKLKGIVTSHYTEMHKLEKKEKDMDYYMDRHNRKHSLGESLILNEYDEYDDFDDETFYEGGREYQWTDTGISYNECINGTCWAVREAIDVDSGEYVYFVVDEDSGDIDWECETPELAIEFIQAKYDDYEEDDFDNIDEEEYEDFFYDDYDVKDYDPFDDDLLKYSRYKESYDYRDKTTRKPFTVGYANGERVNTCIVNAKHKDDARDIFNRKLGKRGYRPIDIKNGRLGYEYPDIDMLIDDDELELDEDIVETTGVGSIGQHKRSAIDIIEKDDDDNENDYDRFNTGEEEDDDEILLEITEETEPYELELDDDFVEINTQNFLPNEQDELELDDNEDTVNTSENEDDIDTSGIVDTTNKEVNIDGSDSTSPMDDNKYKKSGSNSIDI